MPDESPHLRNGRFAPGKEPLISINSGAGWDPESERSVFMNAVLLSYFISPKSELIYRHHFVGCINLLAPELFL